MWIDVTWFCSYQFLYLPYDLIGYYNKFIWVRINGNFHHLQILLLLHVNHI